MFRAEVRAHADDAWLGRIVLIRPLSFTLLTAVAAAFTAALLAYGMLGQYTRKARVAGVLEPQAGVVKVLAPQAGVVQSVPVREGERVAAGAAIARIGDGRTGPAREEIGAAVGRRIAERRGALRSQRAQLARAMAAEAEGLRRRRAGLARELAQIGREIATQEARTALARTALARARALERIGFLSGAALDRERDTQLGQTGQLEALQRARSALQRQREDLESAAAAGRARNAAQLAALDLQRAALEQEGLERGLQYRSAIVAPAGGTVATVLVERGQAVVPGMALATIIPADSLLEAQLFAPSRAIGFVRPGQRVLLRYLAYPHQKFGAYPGRVVAVARDAAFPSELGYVPPDGSREPLYRIRVALASQSISAYGRPRALQPGMRVEADVLLDRRRLVEWIFEPLFSLAGRA